MAFHIAADTSVELPISGTGPEVPGVTLVGVVVTGCTTVTLTFADADNVPFALTQVIIYVVVVAGFLTTESVVGNDFAGPIPAPQHELAF